MKYDSAKQNHFFSEFFCEANSACASSVICLIMSIAAAMLIFVCILGSLILNIRVLSIIIILMVLTVSVIIKRTETVSGGLNGTGQQ